VAQKSDSITWTDTRRLHAGQKLLIPAGEVGALTPPKLTRGCSVGVGSRLWVRRKSQISLGSCSIPRLIFGKEGVPRREPDSST